MKKWTVGLLLFACLFAVVSHKAHKNFSIEGASRATLQSGTTGEKVELTEENQLRQLAEALEGTVFEKGGSSRERSGWEYAVSWYDTAGALTERVVVHDAATISYRHHFWYAVEGSVDTDCLNAFLRAQQ